MPSNNDKAKAVYHFLTEAERQNRTFTLEEIAIVSGWSLRTVRTYRSKKWHSFFQAVDDGYKCSGIINVSEDAFLRIQGQRTDLDGDILRPRFTPTVDSLVDKAREAALLGVQIYNNPLIAFRTPGYIVQMIIAHTALFHAIFERDNLDYWYKNTDGTPKLIDGDRYVWDVSECLKIHYGGQALPEVENLKFFIKIRNKIEHRFVPVLDLTFSGKCQALLMNFESLLINEFGTYFTLGANLALALQLSTFSQEQQEVLRKIQTEEYDSIKKYSDAYDALLPDEITQSSCYSFRAFLIPKIGNHAKSADIAIEFVQYDPANAEDMEKYEKQVAFIREKMVPVANPGKLRPKAVAAQVQAKTGIRFTINNHTNAWKLYKVRPKTRTPHGCKTQYCHLDDAFNDFIYTQEWVDFLCEKIRDPDEFRRIKQYRDP